MKRTKEDVEIMRVVSRRLKVALFEADMSCARLHRETGISDNTVYNIINMRSVPSATMIKKISDVLNVSADWLLGITNTRRRNNG